jgi:hypothetical protein
VDYAFATSIRQGKLRDFKTWAEEKPPVGTLYNYPVT